MERQEKRSGRHMRPIECEIEVSISGKAPRSWICRPLLTDSHWRAGDQCIVYHHSREMKRAVDVEREAHARGRNRDGQKWTSTKQQRIQRTWDELDLGRSSPDGFTPGMRRRGESQADHDRHLVALSSVKELNPMTNASWSEVAPHACQRMNREA